MANIVLEVRIASSNRPCAISARNRTCNARATERDGQPVCGEVVAAGQVRVQAIEHRAWQGHDVLAIAFENQALQQKWVATDLHTQVWSQMEANFAGFGVKNYNTI